MAYLPYADEAYYKQIYQGADIPEDQIVKYLRKASRQIDSLTFNRIVGKGVDRLTPFQQDIVREVVCEHAEFLYNNEELLENVFSSYAINGVSASFGSSWNIDIQKGVAIKKELYQRLAQTGLTGRVLR